MGDQAPFIFDEQTDSDLINQGRRRFVLSLRDQQKRRQRWRRNEQLIAGDHFAVFQDLPEDKSRVVYNAIHEVIETIMPILTDLLPVPEVKPRPTGEVAGLNLRDLMAQAEMLEAGVEDQWEVNNLDESWSMALKSSLDYGNGPMRILTYRKELYVDLIDIFSWFPSPNYRGVKFAQWICTATPVYLSEIAATYGTKIVKGMKTEGKLDHYRNYHLFNKGETASTPHSISNSRPEQSGSDDFVLSEESRPGDRLGEVLLVDMWCVHSLEKTQGDLTEPTESYAEPLQAYQHLTWAGDRICHFQTESKYEIGAPPFIDIVNYPQPNSGWGQGEPDQIEQMNLAIDVILSEATDGAIMAGNPPMKITKDVQQLNPQGIRAQAGKNIVMPNRSSIVEWMQSWQMPAYMQTLPVMMADFINTISGVHDVSQGKKPGQVTAASAIAKLQEAAQSRVRFKVKASMRGPIKHLYELILRHIIDNVSETQSRLGRDKQTGNTVIRQYSGKDLKLADFVVTAGQPLFQNKADFVNLLLQLQLPLGLLPDEMIQLMPPEIRSTIMAIRSSQQGADAREGIDMAQMTPEEKEILNGDDEDARTALLMRLRKRGAFNPPSTQEPMEQVEHGTPANIAA